MHKQYWLFKYLNISAIPLIILYVVSMFIYPWLSSQESQSVWQHVQNVWDRWQGLNVGMLAFISSIVAFNISGFNSNQQRDRNFLASKAFLPDSFSELTSYFKNCVIFVSEAWRSQQTANLALGVPQLPNNYKKVFQECIKYADPIVGKYLATILTHLQVYKFTSLQVYNSRMHGILEANNTPNHLNILKPDLIVYLYRIGHLLVLINKQFEFARSTENFNSTKITWNDFHNAYINLDILIEEFHISDTMNLESFTQRRVNEGIFE